VLIDEQGGKERKRKTTRIKVPFNPTGQTQHTHTKRQTAGSDIAPTQSNERARQVLKGQ
jgi:hypothetical protein